MKSISEIEDQNDVLPTRTKEATHDQKKFRKGGGMTYSINKTYIRGKDAKKKQDCKRYTLRNLSWEQKVL